MDKLLIPCIYLKKEKAVVGFASDEPAWESDPAVMARAFGNSGADEILIFDFSASDEEHDKAIGTVKKICEAAEVPVIGAGNIKRMEDVKKLIYAGCRRAVLNFGKPENCSLLEEVSKKFGKEKMVVYLPDVSSYEKNCAAVEELAGMILCDQGMEEFLYGKTKLRCFHKCLN